MSEPSTTILRRRVTIFEKNGIYGAVALAITADVNMVSRYDVRLGRNPLKHKAFETPAEAEHWFDEYVIATVTENAWTVAWTGTPNNAYTS